MMKEKLNWRRPLFYLLLPNYFMMAFLGFPFARRAVARH